MSASLDIFDLLDVSRREDSYSSVLWHLLSCSPRLRQQVLAHGFGDSAPTPPDARVEFRSALPRRAGVPDLLMMDPLGRWELFIENKIDAPESPGQTQRYFDACRQRVGDRAAGIFLTLDGRPPQACTQVKALKHINLGNWIAELLDDLHDPVLRMAAEAYIRRTRFSPQVRLDEQVESLLKQQGGLLPQYAGIDALGRAIVEAIPEWRHTAIVNQNTGRRSLALKFHRAGWCGTAICGRVFQRDNYNIHTEFEFAETGRWSLKLHFETEPYMHRDQLEQLEGVAEFTAMQTDFRNAIHAVQAKLPGWKISRYRWQVYAFSTELSAQSKVREVVEKLAVAHQSIGPVADAALRAAKG